MNTYYCPTCASPTKTALCIGCKLKRCPRCAKWKSRDLDNYCLNKSAKDGFGCICKECVKYESRQYRKDNKEKSNASSARYREQNVDKIKAQRANSKERYLGIKRIWAANNPDKVKRYALKVQYGITLEKFKEMLFSQGNACAVCYCDFDSVPSKSIHVDHDHDTGTVRAILCSKCNRALGLLKENPDVIRNLLFYAETVCGKEGGVSRLG